MNIKMPKEVIRIIELLDSYNYEAFVVGGCLRDSLLQKKPCDWDICTDCEPNEIIRIFGERGIKTIPTGLKHGTISLIVNDKTFEVTTYRVEENYIDNRRPANVKFTKSLLEDLSRRDFTINSMAYNQTKGLVDPFNGKEDLENKVIRAVGNSNERFKEDSLRIVRGVRFATELGFNFDLYTVKGILQNKELLKNISKERINAELNKILLSSVPSKGFYLFKELDLLDYIIPQLKIFINFNQKNPRHDKDIFEHTMMVLDNTENDLILRLAALLHDIGKPLTFTQDNEGMGHFYNHHSIGSSIAEDILNDLRYDNTIIKKVKILIKEHMSKYNELTDKAAKRLINRVGKDNIYRLFMLQRADIKGSMPPYDFSKIDYLEKKCIEIINNKEPLSVKDLKINGYDLMKIGIKPGKEIGFILNSLLEKVLENPELNNKEDLLDLVKEKF